MFVKIRGFAGVYPVTVRESAGSLRVACHVSCVMPCLCCSDADDAAVPCRIR